MAFENRTVQYRKAKAEGRLCARCGWIVKRKAFKKGERLCEDCVFVGVEISPGVVAHVTKSVQPETLAALAQATELAIKQYQPKENQI